MTTTADTPAQTWRDFADLLNPETVREFEARESLAETQAHIAFPDEDPADVMRRVHANMLKEVRVRLAAKIPLPAGVTGPSSLSSE